MNNTILDNNLKSIENNNNHIILPIDPEIQNFSFFGEGKEIVTVVRDDNYIKYDIIATRTDLKDVNFDFVCIYLVLGLLDVGAIGEIYNKKSQGSVVVVVEPYPEAFFYLISNFNLSDLFVKKDFYLLVADFDSAPQFFSEILLGKGLILKVSNIQLYISRYLLAFEKERSLKLQKSFIDIIKLNLHHIGNSTVDTMIGLKQYLSNLKDFMRSMSIKKLKNKYSSTPVVIVSAGPSLEKNIHELKNIPRENVIIFAVDTTLKKLLDMNIIPDAVLSVERIETVYKFFYENQYIPDELVFVSLPVVFPDILEKFSGNRLLFVLRDTERISEWINYLVSDNSDLVPIGASVAHLAFVFARYLGFDPIIIIGQDLAYGEEGNSHVKGTIYDNKDVKINEQKKLFIEGYHGGEVLTNITWKNFMLWFEQEFFKTEQRVINATEGGAKIKHCQQLPLKDALKAYAQKPCKPLHSEIDKMYVPLFQNEKIVSGRIYNEIESLDRFVKEMENNFSCIKKILKDVKLAKKDKAEQYHRMLINLDNKYKELVSKTGFISIFLQTHIAIAAFEHNRLSRKNKNVYLHSVAKIQLKLFSLSRDLGNLIKEELQSFLSKSFNKDSIL